MIVPGILGPMLGLVMLLFSLWLLRLTQAALLTALAGLVCMTTGMMGLQTSMAEFSFDADGVSVKYPLEKEHFYPWEEFQQVCVCYYSRATEMHGYPLICLVRKGEKRDSFGRWKTGSFFHYRNLLCLDYSELQLTEIRRFCPYEIPDLRGKGNYRL